MKILFVNHGGADSMGGGDGVQIRETAKRLANRGTGGGGEQRPAGPAGFDLVHIFNCRAPQSFEQQIASCRAAGVPTVVSPIWVSIPQAIWGSRGSMAVVNRLVQEPGAQADQGLRQLIGRELTVHLDDGSIEADGRGSRDMSWMKRVGALRRGWMVCCPTAF